MADATESIGILQFALDAVVDQQQTIANNISNEDTPNFQADQVTFQSSLEQALEGGGVASVVTTPEGLASGTRIWVRFSGLSSMSLSIALPSPARTLLTTCVTGLRLSI